MYGTVSTACCSAKRCLSKICCNRVEDTRQRSSMASSARLVVLIYFRLLGQINSPPFVDAELGRLQMEGRLQAPAPADPPIPLLPMALRRFAQDEAHVA